MEPDKKWVMLGAGAAALGLCAWMRHTACKPSDQTTKQRKSYEQGATRQYSLPHKGNSDIAASYREVMIVAHRGASGSFPEHTQKGYHEVHAAATAGRTAGTIFVVIAQAVRAGADVVEMDTCHLVVRHDVLLDGDSNVDQIFGKSRVTNEKVFGSMDGDFTEAEGYFVHNFTLAEVKTLRCLQRMEGRKKFPDSDHKIMTLVEACTYLEHLRHHVIDKYDAKRDFGIYVETKRSAWHQQLRKMDDGIQSAKSMEEAYVDDIIASGFSGRVYVQSFEPQSLKEIKRLQLERCPNAEWVYIRLLTSQLQGHQRGYDQDTINQLLPLPWKSESITDGDTGETEEAFTNEFTKDGETKLDEFFKEVATYASGIGPWKNDILPNPCAPLERSPVVDMAHKHGLAVHPYTFRSDILKLPEMYMGNAVEEYARFFELGVDGEGYHKTHRELNFRFLEDLHPHILSQQRMQLSRAWSCHGQESETSL